jgi:hypothetical protein
VKFSLENNQLLLSHQQWLSVQNFKVTAFRI